MLGQEPDASHRTRLARTTPQHKGFARSGMNQSEEHLDRGGLARAVRSQKPKYFTGIDCQVQPLDCNEITVGFAQSTCFDGHHAAMTQKKRKSATRPHYRRLADFPIVAKVTEGNPLRRGAPSGPGWPRS